MSHDLDQAIVAVRIDAQKASHDDFNQQKYAKLFEEIEQDLTLFHGKDADVFVSRAIESLVKNHIIPDLSIMKFDTKDAKISLNGEQIEISNKGEKITITPKAVTTKPDYLKLALNDLSEHNEGRSVRSVLAREGQLQAKSNNLALTAKVNFDQVHVEANTSHWKVAVDHLQAKGIQNPSRLQAEAEVARLKASEPKPSKK